MDKVKLRKRILLGSICTIMAGQAQAGSEVETLIKMLHANGTVDDAQFGRLMNEIRVGSEIVTAKKKQRLEQLDKATNVTLKVDKGGINVASSDGEFAIKIGGRVQVDSAWYDDDGTSMGNGTEVRRARLYLQGKMFKDWGYKLQYDFIGNGRSGIKDAFITYNGFNNIQFKLGNFKDPFMLQEQTSSKYVTFTERSLMDAFSAGRHIGAMASTAHKHWTVAAGYFGGAVNTSSANNKDDGWGVAGRATYTPINEKTHIIHLGIAADYRKVGDSETLRFKQQAETHVASVNIVDTNTILNADNYLKLGAELAVVEGPFSVQSEYVWTTVERNIGSDVDFNGWYAEASYFLTGESRHYKKGHFASVTPNSIVGRKGIGAWQLATRYSMVDLNNVDIQGGKAESVTLGVNWLPTPTLRFSGNYVKVLNVNKGATKGQEPSLFQLRGQWAF